MKKMSSGVHRPPIADTGRNASVPSTPRVDAPPAGRSAAECRDLFLTEQETIKAAISQIARRYRLSRADTEELASEISLKLLDNDCLILRKFEGRSSLRTYLAVVINRLFLDSRTAGRKWRPSAIAKRNGQVAMVFERLTVRDGFSFDQACTLLEIARGGVDRNALETLAGSLPVRIQWRPIWPDEMPDVAVGNGDPAAEYEAGRRAELAARSRCVLKSELEMLSPEDRRIVRRHFREGATVMTVARELSLDPKTLYRHIARLLKMLRQRLEARGVTCLDARELPL